MENEQDFYAEAFREFVNNIAQLNVQGERLKDGAEIVWDETYAKAQLWEIILNARLLSGPMPSSSTRWSSGRRVAEHKDCVATYPMIAHNKYSTVSSISPTNVSTAKGDG